MLENRKLTPYFYLSFLLYSIGKFFGSIFLFLTISILLFFILYPTWFIFLPIPSDRIIQFIGILFFVFFVLLRKKIFLDQRFILFIGVSFFIAFISWLALLWSSDPNLYLVKRLSNIIFFSFSFYFIIYFINQFIPNLTLGKFLDYVIYVVLIQALVSLFLFLNPTLYENFISIIRPEANEGLLERIHLIQIRLLGISNSFFTASTNYGIHILILMLIPYCKGSAIYKNRLLYYAALAIIITAGILSGRTVIFAILLGLGYIIIMERKRVIPLILKSLKVLFFLMAIFIAIFLILRNFIDLTRFERIASWAFEIFIQYSDGGQITSSSTDVMLKMYKWPEDISTWIIGHGLILNSDGSYYMHSDIGYIRLLYYFGVIGTITFIIAQFYYYKIAANYYSNPAIKLFLFFLFIWILILNLKGLSDGDLYFSLFAVYGSIQYRSYKLDNAQHGMKLSFQLTEDIKIKRRLRW